ncbi:RNA polymerase sigma factor [Tenacibaculum sp. nBUS_03]|uniref:RNA polymerase sigma factor n=1 Tax=Tenacibaculum sp. nBUS_03 TaxID=3395320 RepID=UPI003EBCDCF1
MTESERYLNALLKGDERITAEIYSKFYRKVSSFILANKGKQEDVEDVFHDALMYLIIAHKKQPLKINSFEGYFFTICKNIWKTSLKNKNKQVINNNVLPLEDKDVDLSLLIIQQQRRDLYREAFHKLSANCKEILGNYFNGMGYQELLEEFSYSTINTIRQRVFKCKTKLISLIKKDHRYNKLK